MYPMPLTLAEFFKARSGADIVSRALKSQQRTKLKGIPGLGWELVKRKFEDAFEKMLGVKMVDILRDTLILVPELQVYHNRNTYHPAKAFHKTLAELTIRSEHHPKLEILLEQKRIAKLTFDVDLELKLEGFVLKIEDGRIREIATGTCQGVITIACRGHELASEPTPKYQLPGKIVLDAGIQLPRQEPKPLPQPRLKRPFALLVGIGGPVKGQKFSMDKAHYRIGWNSDNDLCITRDDCVSGLHACLRHEEGRLLLSDQGSKNGTFLNKKRVWGRPFEVRTGDHIRLGESVFKVRQLKV
jgi:hypothetical protein